ncbi:hypothetical protein [Cuniculiplasma divulgatum]|uniref:Membrane protein n=1 Tax=Cuniculiplasma divulgatum TaxID=1673428 RepID=A0A1N5V6H6_9ARCH|nr:hypothetical protein [Cuniculiplasma divulgatum]EQB69678.1 MAG: hypothetical protein AMDU5_GPLC00003G0228 [Thermoplasmatales archaeon Gpl]MCI2412613.1 hypothetical protein [Cuniculiplasma sp.]WMT49372.1 MAG: hypothetical protein RE472_00030 [Thermoplasmatales archaeon]SIM68239.1 membrane protein [Cuniculiplasma divulgatum]SJK85044.1 membrane protein [Cuniculiplasma divulgatum]
MNEKVPLKYTIIFIILTLPLEIESLISLLTPYGYLFSWPLISYAIVASTFFGAGFYLFAMYKTDKDMKNNL